MIDFKYLFDNEASKLDLENSLKIYKKDINSFDFAEILLELLKLDSFDNCKIHFFKAGSFSIILKISIVKSNKQENFFVKLYRNKSPVPEYTPARMKMLCLREYSVLKALERELYKEPDIGGVKPVAIIPELASFITEECSGIDFQQYLKKKVRHAFLNPLSPYDKKFASRYLYIECIAKLFAKLHELNLDYDLFKEKEPFYVLDFDYKKEKLLEALHRFPSIDKKEVNVLLEGLTRKSEELFPLLENTGLACIDTNLSNFIINCNKVYMMDFFLVQFSSSYQPIGKFLACLELALYPFIPKSIIKDLRDKFIDVYNINAKNKLNLAYLNFFISWNYMTVFPRFKFNWKYFYRSSLLNKKFRMIFEDWKNYLN